jgi:hypothetical protein
MTGFNSQSMKGTWRLQIQDIANNDGGALQTWGLRLCANNYCGLRVSNANANGPGSFKEALACSLNGDTISFASSLENVTFSLQNDFAEINKNLVILADPSKNLTMTGTNAENPIIVINPGIQLSIQGLDIRASSVTQHAILARGKCILNNLSVYRASGSSISSFRSSSGGSLDVFGQVNIE